MKGDTRMTLAVAGVSKTLEFMRHPRDAGLLGRSVVVAHPNLIVTWNTG